MTGKQHFELRTDGTVVSANAFFDRGVDASSFGISEEVAKRQTHPSMYIKQQLPSGIDQLVAEDRSAGVICLEAKEILKRYVKGKDDRIHKIQIVSAPDHIDNNAERGSAHAEIRYSPYFESNKGQVQLRMVLAAVANLWFSSGREWARRPDPMPPIQAVA